jgi:hypothetical protein
MGLFRPVKSLARRAKAHFQRRQEYCRLAVDFVLFEAKLDARLP